MKKLLFLVVAAFLFAAPVQAQTCTPYYPQDFHFLQTVDEGGYREMGTMVELPSGKIFMAMTVASDVEGGADEHVEAWRTITTDWRDGWEKLGGIDPDGMSEISWGSPWLSDEDDDGEPDRLWVVQLWNKNNVREIPYEDTGAKNYKMNSIGWPRVKYSDDEGETWNTLTGPLPGQGFATYQPTDIDLRNPWDGMHKLQWFTGNVVTHGDYAYYGFAKRGRMVVTDPWGDTEAFIGRFAISPQDNSEFTVLPDGPTGIRSPTTFPNGNPVPPEWLGRNEELSLDFFDDGVMYGVYRTVTGRLGAFYSTDGGHTVTSTWAKRDYGDEHRTVYNARSAPMVKNLGDGTWLLWTNNTDGAGNTPDRKTWKGRNVVWFSLGEREGNEVIWGHPRTLIYSADIDKSLSYPSRPLDLGDEWLFSVSDKSSVRVFSVPKTAFCQ